MSIRQRHAELCEDTGFFLFCIAATVFVGVVVLVYLTGRWLRCWGEDDSTAI